MMRYLVVVILTAALALMSGCPGGGSGGGGSLGTAKDFSYAKYDGGPGRLSEHSGKVTVVNFWAVW